MQIGIATEVGYYLNLIADLRKRKVLFSFTQKDKRSSCGAIFGDTETWGNHVSLGILIVTPSEKDGLEKISRLAQK